jgi:uncharacterized protein YyaL (SSP411 family)
MRLLTVLFLLMLSQAAAALENRLKGHPSPYLAMHGDDPVHWQAWSPALLEQAAAQGKLILISSGYFACHWCHVMQRESYRDPAVAERLNAGFIAVKLDRELHPAIDAHLIDFVERTQGAAGWPLNVFLTPEGYPLAGLTYAPRDNFLAILDRVRQLWQAEPARAMVLAREAMAEIVRQRAALTAPMAPAAGGPRQGLLNEALSLADELAGGFGEQSRFPMAPQLTALLRLQQQHPSPRLRAFLILTLEQMAREGLRDHLAGGFFRYTVDPAWQVPHYEKMLYSQALLARLYLQAGRLFARPDFLAVAADTLDFVLQHMRGRDGGYIASLSAVDDRGEEGGPYLWTDAQLADVLGEQLLPLARRHWRLSGIPATESGYLPLAGESPEQLTEGADLARVTTMLTTARQRLLAARAQRGLPRDHKQLAGWNGLLLLALAEAGQQLGEPRYRQVAAELGDFLAERLWDGQHLARAVEGGQLIGQAGLADYVYVAAGLAAIGKRQLSGELQQAAWRLFHDRAGWRRTAGLPLPGMAVEPALMDDVLPSASATLIALSAQVDDAALRQQADRATEAAREMVGLSPFWYAGHALLLADREMEAAQR